MLSFPSKTKNSDWLGLLIKIDLGDGKPTYFVVAICNKLNAWNSVILKIYLRQQQVYNTFFIKN